MSFDGGTTWFGRKRLPLPSLPDWPTQSDHWTGDRPKSKRTNLPLFLKPLPDNIVQDIADNAQSREDFHDYNIIMGPPYWGNCNCALRIIGSTKCAEYYVKNKDGPDGKTVAEGHKHWAWYLDIAPNRIVCPFAAIRAKGSMSGKRYQACREILKTIPKSSWALEQHPDDPKGTIAGRIATDVVWVDRKCPRCEGMDVSDDNELRKSQMYKINVVEDRQYPSIPPVGWPEGLYETPVEYRPLPGSNFSAYPLFQPGQLYAPSQLTTIPPEHIHIPEIDMSLAQFWDHQVESKAAHEAALKASAEAASKMARELEAHARERDEAEKYAASKDKGSWHCVGTSHHPGFYY